MLSTSVTSTQNISPSDSLRTITSPFWYLSTDSNFSYNSNVSGENSSPVPLMVSLKIIISSESSLSAAKTGVKADDNPKNMLIPKLPLNNLIFLLTIIYPF